MRDNGDPFNLQVEGHHLQHRVLAGSSLGKRISNGLPETVF
jgi:hypothetical protein